MLLRDTFRMKESVAAINIPTENVLKLFPLKLVIINEFGVNFLRIKK